MKIRRSVLLTFEVDTDAWAAEYDIAPTTAGADFDTSLINAAPELAEMVSKGWPAVRDLVAVSSSAPLTENTLPDALDAAGLDLWQVRTALRRRHEAECAGVAVEALRGWLATEDHGGRVPRYVIVASDSWDDQYILSASALTVVYEDGTEVSNLHVDQYPGEERYGATLHNALTRGWGAVQPLTALAFDLKTGEVSEQQDERDLRESLGLRPTD